LYGHDGFLLESAEKITPFVASALAI